MDDVNTFECLNILNETNINYKIKKKMDCTFDIEIRNMLKDETVFFKIPKRKAYQILQYIGIKNEFIDNAYNKLISPEIFYDLLYYKKIDINDKNLLVRYPNNND